MTEIPDDDATRGDEDKAARDSLAGDLARELDPDVHESGEDSNGGTNPETDDQP